MTHWFSPDPKDDLNYLFGRAEPVERLERTATDESRLIVVTGLKKSGKTSLIQSVMVSQKPDSVIYVDIRDTGDTVNLDREKTLDFFKIAINRYLEKNKTLTQSLGDHLKMIKGIQYAGFQIEFDTSSKSQINLIEIFHHLNEWAKEKSMILLLIIDEAQYLKKSDTFDMSKILAGIYDKFRNLKIILTGSEMDLLFKFLGDDDPEAALNSKPRVEIELRPLHEDRCIEFLMKGFKERGFTISMDVKEVIDYAAKKLGGRIGWLNEFGLKCIAENNISEESVNDIVELRAISAKNEFEKFLKEKNQENYYDIIEYLANLDLQHNFTKYFVERHSTKRCIEKLRRAGFIQNFQGLYSISDPVLEYSFTQTDFDGKRKQIIKKAKLELKKQQSLH